MLEQARDEPQRKVRTARRAIARSAAHVCEERLFPRRDDDDELPLPKRAVVLVKPGIYREAVRMTADVSLCALGARGSAIVRAPG